MEAAWVEAVSGFGLGLVDEFVDELGVCDFCLIGDKLTRNGEVYWKLASVN